MKKALALVLALVLALSLGVSAFAATLTLIPLDKEAADPTYKTPITIGLDYDGTKEIFLAPSKGGTYYFELNNTSAYPLRDIAVSTNGPIAAEIVKYDPNTMSSSLDTGVWKLTKNGEEVTRADLSAAEQAAYDKVEADLGQKNYMEVVKGEYVWHKESNPNDGYEGKSVNTDNRQFSPDNLTALQILNHYLNDDEATKGDFEKASEAAMADIVNRNSTYAGWSIEKKEVFVSTSEAYVKDFAEGMNTACRTSRFGSTTAKDGDPLLKITVDPNYTAAYKEASFKVTATRVDAVDQNTKRVTKTTKVVYEGTIISDVVIFEYEEVKWAGANGVALEVGEKGYSDYYVNGNYGVPVYVEEDLRNVEGAAVISTTAFRALREAKYGIKVNAEDLVVSIPEIGSSQKGVNFAAYGVDFYNSKGKTTETRGTAVKAKFGFYGNQTIASDFTVEVDFGMNAYKLREMFGEKVEEEDIITYYVVEGTTVAGQFTVDYMKDDIDEDIVLEINRKAGSTLGQYELVLEVPTAPAGEENPNTGAESVIGVVAAMAVVSLAAAAAVSLKK